MMSLLSFFFIVYEHFPMLKCSNSLNFSDDCLTLQSHIGFATINNILHSTWYTYKATKLVSILDFLNLFDMKKSQL